MRKNRKRNKRMSVTAVRSLNVAGLIVVAFVMVVLNALAKSNAEAIQKEIGDKQRTLARLEEDRTREEARWNRLCSTKSLQSAMLNHGIRMDSPNVKQVVRMGANRLPVKGQLSVDSAQERARIARTAKLSPRTRQ